MDAKFNRNDHATRPGWATYHKRRNQSLRQRVHGLLGHRLPASPPSPANGYSPSNYARCGRCRVWLKWFVVGQHRFGSIADFALATGEAT